jgi:hypothetical protein
MKEGVGDRSTDALVEQDKHGGHFDAFRGEAIGVAPTLALQEAVGSELADVVAKLGERIGLGGDREGLEHGAVHVGAAPGSELRATMEQDLHQPEEAGVVDLDARNLGGRRRDGFGQSLEDREIHVDVEEVGLDPGEPIGDGDESCPERREVLQPFVQAEIFEAIDADLDTQERAKLFVHPRHEALAVDAQHVVSVVDFLQHGVQLATEPLVFPDAKDLRDRIRGQAEDPELARALEDLVDREVAAEDDIAAQLDLVERVGAAEIDRGALLLRELWADDEGPVVESLPDDLGIESVGRGLQRGHICGPEKRVVVFPESDPLPLQFPGDDVVPVEVVGGLEGHERTDAEHERSEHFVADVEVVVGVAGPLPRHDAVVRVVGGVFGEADAELLDLVPGSGR